MKHVLRLFALALLLTLCLSASALAADKSVTISYIGPATLKPGQTAKVLSTKTAKDGTVVYTLTDTVKKTVIYTETKTGVSAGQEIQWSVPYYDEEMTAKKPIKKIRATFTLDGKSYTYDLFYTYTKDQKNGDTVTVENAVWYPDNTACSFGPAFRDVRPSLTDKWYLFTPIDLTRQGRQTFEYVASNKYVIGEVYVDVSGDYVWVTYHNFYEAQNGNTETLSEFFTFFPDLKSVRDVNPESLGDSGFRFGKPISIAEELNGDTNVLLFIRNRVTYRDYVNDSHKLVRFWPNISERKELRQQMQAMMDR